MITKHSSSLYQTVLLDGNDLQAARSQWDYQRRRCLLTVNVTGTVTEVAPVALSVILPV